MTEERDVLGAYFCLEVDMSILEKYLDLSERRTYKKGQQICSIGERLYHLIYLKSGKAGRLVTAENGNEKYIKVVCEESILGEVYFFQQGSCNASFIAIEPCECYFFDRDTVNNVLLKDEQVVQKLIQWFCSRMTALSAQITDNMVKDPQYHVYKFLLDYAKKFGGRDNQGHWVYDGKLSHYDISKYLGINRVSVSNVIKELQDMEIIYKDRTRLIILDEFFLEQF